MKLRNLIVAAAAAAALFLQPTTGAQQPAPQPERFPSDEAFLKTAGPWDLKLPGGPYESAQVAFSADGRLGCVHEGSAPGGVLLRLQGENEPAELVDWGHAGAEYGESALSPSGAWLVAYDYTTSEHHVFRCGTAAKLALKLRPSFLASVEFTQDEQFLVMNEYVDEIIDVYALDAEAGSITKLDAGGKQVEVIAGSDLLTETIESMPHLVRPSVKDGKLATTRIDTGGVKVTGAYEGELEGDDGKPGIRRGRVKGDAIDWFGRWPETRPKGRLCAGGTLVARHDADETLCLFEAAGGTPLRAILRGDAIRFNYAVSPDGTLVFQARAAGIRAVQVKQHRDAQVGEFRFKWTQPVTASDPARFALLDLRADVRILVAERTTTGLEVALTARNNGQRTAQAVMIEASAEPVEGLAPLRFVIGDLDPGAAIQRTVMLSLKPEAAEFGLRLRAVDALGHRSEEFRYQYLPRTVWDAAGYDKLIERLMQASLEELRKLTGRQELAAKKVKLGPWQIGFFAGDGNVYYQPSYELTGMAARDLARLAGSRDNEHLMRAAEMILYWTIPHEVIHLARGDSFSWHNEYCTNVVQPWLSQAVLERLKITHINADSMSRFYESVLAHLALTTWPGWRRTVDAYIRQGGRDQETLDGMSPGELFSLSPDAYCFYALRIAQDSASRPTSLEELVKEHVK